MVLEAFNQCIFCAALQNMVDGVDYTIARSCFNVAKKHLLESHLSNETLCNFFHAFVEQYRTVATNQVHFMQVCNAVAFLSSTEIYCNPYAAVEQHSYSFWSIEEIKYLIRAVFHYGTVSYSTIKENALPNRSISAIKTKWTRLFDANFRIYVSKYDTAADVPQINDNEFKHVDVADIKNEPQLSFTRHELIFKQDPLPPIEYTNASVQPIDVAVDNAVDDSVDMALDADPTDVIHIVEHFDPKIAEKFCNLKLTMTYRMAQILVKRDDIEPKLLIEQIFETCTHHVMLTAQLVAVLRCYIDFRKNIDEEMIFSVFESRWKCEEAWLVLEELIYQRLVSVEFISKMLEQRKDIVPFPGFRIDPFIEFLPMKITKNCMTARDAKNAAMNIGKSFRDAATQVDGIVREGAGNKFLAAINEAVDHKKGIAYTDESKYFYEVLYLMKPSVITFLNECGIAPHPDTVFSWIEKKEKEIVYCLQDEAKLIELIHNTTDKHMREKGKPVYANLAGDGVYLTTQDGQKKHKTLQYFAVQLQPLDKSIPCVCISIHSIGKKGSGLEMDASDIPKKLVELANKINADNTFKVVYISTDADHSTDKLHQTFFNKFIANIDDEALFENAIAAWKWDDFIPISDFLHLIKAARAHLLNHAM